MTVKPAVADPRGAGVAADRAHLEAAAEALGAQQLPCAVCRRREAEHVGAFAPTNADLQQLVGTPQGRLRVILYPVCDRCAEHASLETREIAALRFVHVATQRERAGWQ